MWQDQNPCNAAGRENGIHLLWESVAASPEVKHHKTQHLPLDVYLGRGGHTFSQIFMTVLLITAKMQR